MSLRSWLCFSDVLYLYMNEIKESENRLLPFEVFIFYKLHQKTHYRLKSALFKLLLSVMIADGNPQSLSRR